MGRSVRRNNVSRKTKRKNLSKRNRRKNLSKRNLSKNRLYGGSFTSESVDAMRRDAEARGVTLLQQGSDNMAEASLMSRRAAGKGDKLFKLADDGKKPSTSGDANSAAIIAKRTAEITGLVVKLRDPSVLQAAVTELQVNNKHLMELYIRRAFTEDKSDAMRQKAGRSVPKVSKAIRKLSEDLSTWLRANYSDVVGLKLDEFTKSVERYYDNWDDTDNNLKSRWKKFPKNRQDNPFAKLSLLTDHYRVTDMVTKSIEDTTVTEGVLTMLADVIRHIGRVEFHNIYDVRVGDHRLNHVYATAEAEPPAVDPVASPDGVGEEGVSPDGAGDGRKKMVSVAVAKAMTVTTLSKEERQLSPGVNGQRPGITIYKQDGTPMDRNAILDAQDASMTVVEFRNPTETERERLGDVFYYPGHPLGPDGHTWALLADSHQYDGLTYKITLPTDLDHKNAQLTYEVVLAKPEIKRAPEITGGPATLEGLDDLQSLTERVTNIEDILRTNGLTPS